MKFFTLLFVAVLSAIILIGCDRQLLSPLKEVPEPPTNTQFAQMALSDLAETATERGLIDLANAASGLAEVLAIEGGTSAQPIFSRLAKLADAVTVLEQVFVGAGCSIELQKFAEASVNTVKAYTIRNAPDMEQALENLAQEALNAKTALLQLPTENNFIPFAFDPSAPYAIDVGYMLGVILVQYDETIRPIPETRLAVIEVFTNKGYKVQANEVRAGVDAISLDAAVDPLFFRKELINIPGIVLVPPNFPYAPAIAIPPIPPPTHVQIINQVRIRYNEAWCQGNFDLIDNILIEESGLDFFDYSFLRNLADTYAEEIPETAERIEAKGFSLRSIAINFLDIYLQNSEKTLDEIIELFRQVVRTGNVSLEQVKPSNYYLLTDYWD